MAFYAGTPLLGRWVPNLFFLCFLLCADVPRGA
jgi:hypothetical protein